MIHRNEYTLPLVLLKPTLFDFDFSASGSLGYFFETTFGCTARRTTVVVWQVGPSFRAFGKHVATVLDISEKVEIKENSWREILRNNVTLGVRH